MAKTPADKKATSGTVPRGRADKKSESAAAGGITRGKIGRLGGAEAAVSHGPVRGGGAVETEAAETVPVAFGAEDLYSEAADGGPATMEALEAVALPAGVLSYGDVPSAGFERLRAAVLAAAPAPARGPDDFTIESVLGVDTRFRADPSAYPNSAICFLVSEFPLPNGRTVGALGTGWIVGKRTVITAGHCVFAHGPEFGSRGVFASRVAVFPARDGQDRPHSFTAQTNQLLTTDGWVRNRSRAADYAAIILADELPADLGAFGFGPDLSAAVRDGPFRVAGYPGEFQKTDLAATQWEDAGTVRVEGPHLAYRIDTTPGQSGGPVFFINRSDNPDERFAVAVGIHNYGIPDPTGQRRIRFPESQPGDNNATYITGEVLNNLTAWKAEGDR